MKILLANGVNLDLLGRREPHLYGRDTLADIERVVTRRARELASGGEIALTCFQTNSESAYLERLSSEPWDGMILNPGAWTHSSWAVADRLRALAVVYAEVHVSRVAAREPSRRKSYVASGAVLSVAGIGTLGYVAALDGLVHYLRTRLMAQPGESTEASKRS